MPESESLDQIIAAPSRELDESSRGPPLQVSHESFSIYGMPAETPVLDLAFAMDCTESMKPHLGNATNKIREIIDTIDSDGRINVRFALTEYRDHLSQDSTVVAHVQDFTKSVANMKLWLNECRANGGGDGPEAVADALHHALNLSWRPEAAKICILISDSPPHGVEPAGGDAFPDGCPCGNDPMEMARQMAKKKIILYTVGVGPSFELYRPYFKSLARIARGDYFPMENAERLAPVIIAGVCEESTSETQTGTG